LKDNSGKEKWLMIDHLNMMIGELPSENEDLISQHKLTWHSQGAYGGWLLY